MTRAVRSIVLSLALVGLCGCAGSNRSVRREAPGSGRELSGNWSSVDAKETAEKLIQECLSKPWIERFAGEEGRNPRVRVRGPIVNKTDEHIDSQVFIKSIEAAMLNSGKLSVLSQEGNETAAARRAQDDAISGRVAEGASVGNEVGEDFVISVRVGMVLDQVEGEKVKLYKVNFELTNASSTEKVWIGEHEIQKYVKQKKVSW